MAATLDDLKMSNEKYDVETALHEILRQFAVSHPEKPVKIVLSPPFWVKFVNAFHHLCNPTSLVREIQTNPHLYEQLKKLDFYGVRIELADHVTVPEAVVVGRADLLHHARRLNILGR